MPQKKFSITYWFLIIGFILLNLLSLQLPFFWENVLLSAQFGLHFYENGWSNAILASDIDCGHPPFFGLYLAGVWQVFGKTLWVSHLAMLPFLLLIAHHYYKLVVYFIPKPYQLLAALFLFFEPSVVAQLTMVSNDVVQLSGFVWGLSAIVYKKPIQLIPATLLLASVSVRGAVIVFLLFVAGIALTKAREGKWDFVIVCKLLLYFIPSFLFFVIWNWWHLHETGSLLLGNNPKWADHYDNPTIKTVLKHIAVIIRNFLDFGRVFLWMGMIALFVKYRSKMTNRTKELLTVFFLIVLIFSLVLLSQTNPIGHRYFLPFYTLSILLFFALLPDPYTGEFEKKWKLAKRWILVAGIGLIMGNLWIYPQKIAQGWDSSLAHLHYFKLRTEMRKWIEDQQIPPKEIGAGFTLHRSSKYIELNNDSLWSMSRLGEGIHKHKYYLHSNLINDISDESIDELNTEWKLLQEWRQMGVFLQLYENPGLTP